MGLGSWGLLEKKIFSACRFMGEEILFLWIWEWFGFSFEKYNCDQVGIMSWGFGGGEK